MNTLTTGTNTAITLCVELTRLSAIGDVYFVVDDLLAEAGWPLAIGEIDVKNHGIAGKYSVDFVVDGARAVDDVELAFLSVACDGVGIVDVHAAPCGA